MPDPSDSKPSTPGAHAPPHAAAAPSPGTPAPLDDRDRRDLELVLAARRGDRRAWTALLADYQDRLYGVCIRMIGSSPAARQTCIDLCQDAMVRIIRGIHTFDGTSRVSTWMIRVTMNVCLSWLRSQRLRRHQSLEGPRTEGHPTGPGGRNVRPRGREEAGADMSRVRTASGLEHPGVGGVLPGPEGLEQEDERRRVAEALERIDPEQRALLVLRDVRGLGYEQIAEVLGVPLGTVKSRIFRARAALRDVLDAGERTGEAGEAERG
jgi:RNA polymerase sigma-70 factor (ECF subfamily)